ncbi:Hypothetical predicted protein [Podarcis lilfordi]|uniref:Uncharacterized protein n=1 Tax=Podarcis lilfordi TaxID=74358 RepID=A0AA35NWH1_9SAUR|nr:Hypothetical predicted protein [Podarcis lilfordi]
MWPLGGPLAFDVAGAGRSSAAAQPKPDLPSSAKEASAEFQRAEQARGKLSLLFEFPFPGVGGGIPLARAGSAGWKLSAGLGERGSHLPGVRELTPHFSSSSYSAAADFALLWTRRSQAEQATLQAGFESSPETQEQHKKLLEEQEEHGCFGKHRAHTVSPSKAHLGSVGHRPDHPCHHRCHDLPALVPSDSSDHLQSPDTPNT